MEKIAAGGTELCVYKRSAFEKMQRPWYYGPMMLDTSNGRMMTEDYHLARRAMEAGVDVYVDWNVPLVHCADGGVTVNGEVRSILDGV